MRASLVTVATLCLAGFFSPSAQAQFTGDPFDVYRNGYAASSYPVYSNIGPLNRNYKYTNPPGLGLGIGLSNSPSGDIPYVQNLNNQLTAPSGVVGIGGAPTIAGISSDPYGVNRARRMSKADREYNDEMAKREQDYADEREAIEDIYLDAMNEKDPVRRRELMKEYHAATRKANLTPARQRRIDGPPNIPTSESSRRTANARETPLPTTYEDMLRFNRTLFTVVLKSADAPPAPTTSAPPGR
jgi:hypothetical protein